MLALGGAQSSPHRYAYVNDYALVFPEASQLYAVPPTSTL